MIRKTDPVQDALEATYRAVESLGLRPDMGEASRRLSEALRGYMADCGVRRVPDYALGGWGWGDFDFRFDPANTEEFVKSVKRDRKKNEERDADLAAWHNFGGKR